ncbi:MAG: TIGR00266 family protein [Candidatus Latescibacterota bacterium]|nr:TIGR00266 family protein [Candidatus Latescibacterota bacterium]MEE3264041.1 TIGR00266 family protein [Candidatus Latescibacterota bacterium]
MRCEEIDYTIHGNDLQVVEVELDPGETVIAEAGAMNWMDDHIEFEAKMGDGSKPDGGFMGKLLDVGKRAITGESLFMTHFRNQGRDKAQVAFGAPYPGHIIPVDMSTIGDELICQKDAFLCAALGTELSIAFNRKLGTGFFGGEGFILQRLRGDGMAFLHAGGTVVKRELRNELIRVDTGCLVAFSPGINYDIEMTRGLKSMFFGGEGMFLATLRGTGTVYLQSLPFSRLADRILEHAPAAGGKRQGEGSVLGGLGDLLDGDN